MKEIPLANKIRNLKQGQSFQVATESERQKVNRMVKTLKECGYLSLQIITRSDGKGGFTVAAI